MQRYISKAEAHGSMMKFNLLPEDVILHIFSFMSLKVLLGTISCVFKLWHKICDDPTIVRKASAKEFYSVRLSENLTHQQLQIILKSYLGPFSRR